MFKGVIKTTVGYAAGTTDNPTYRQVCSGNTGHAEVCRIDYDPSQVTLEKLLEIFFRIHDPTSLNRQGSDIGTEYRSIILYTTAAQRDAAKRFMKGLQNEYASPIVTELKKLDKFYPAEEEHQMFFKKNPYNAYCAFVVRPKVAKAKKEFGLA